METKNGLETGSSQSASRHAIGDRKMILWVVVSVLLMVAVAGVSAFVAVTKITKATPQPQEKQATPASQSDNDVSLTLSRDENADQSIEDENEAIDANPEQPTEIIKKGWIEWQEPTDVGDLGLAPTEFYQGCGGDLKIKCPGEGVYSAGMKYAKTGEVIKGDYQEGELYVFTSWVAEGPMYGPDVFRVLKFKNDYYFLGRDLPEYYLNNNYLQSIYSIASEHVLINTGLEIEELQFPEVIYGSNGREKLIADGNPEAFFSSVALRPMFAHPVFGQVWTTNEAVDAEKLPPFKLNTYLDWDGKDEAYDPFSRSGFYLKAPDGMAIAYRLDIDIFSSMETQDADRWAVLDATWDNGEINTTEYEISPSGCGSSRYVYNETEKIDLGKDGIPVGKTAQGDVLYGYRNLNHPDFLDLYENVYWVEDGQEKKPAAEFLADHPKVFWKDPFGRTIAFYSTKIISPAECGKPVIYLYPEQPTEVSVKVAPGSGISVSDPLYRNGWKVLAQSNGELTNLEDGRKYPYLFWEGQGSVFYQTPGAGFMVKRANLVPFFDDALGHLGLVEKEISDFKEFWIPQMLAKEKPYYFVTFLSRRFIDKLAPLTIDPKPDTVIRVLMDYKGMDEVESFPEIPLTAPERKGFTVVEWGGMLK